VAPDDLLGTRIRCPSCGEFFVVDRKYAEPPSEDVREGSPLGAAPKPDPREPINLENQIYDGLPPLSVMLALRRRQGRDFDEEEFSRRYPMTDDDWKALAAFEKALAASASVSTAFWIGLLALAGNIFHWFVIVDAASSRNAQLPLARALAMTTGAACIGLCIACLRLGVKRLSRVVVGDVLEILPYAALTLALLFIGISTWDVVGWCSGESVTGAMGFVVISGVYNAVACLAALVATVRSFRAVSSLRPPEVSHRLIEALKYLD
jgi:hypothetical protein